MDRLQHPALASPGQAADVARQLRSDARYLWFGVIGRPVHFRTIGDRLPHRVRREQPGADEPDHRANHPR